MIDYKQLKKLKNYCRKFSCVLTDSQKDLLRDFMIEEELKDSFHMNSEINSYDDLIIAYHELQDFMTFRSDYFTKRLEALELILSILYKEEEEPKEIYYFYLKEARIIAMDYFKKNLSINKGEDFFLF